MLKRVDSKIDEFLNDLKEPIVENLYQNITSGKKLRAKLILKIADKKDEAFTLAAIVEMIHAASLLHDDVIDEAQTRRGAVSINALFGNKTAIMLGDILYSKAFYELTSFDKKIAKIISDAVAKLSVGELLDVELSKDFNSDKERYFDMIYKKTASLIEACASSAAYLSGLDEKKFALYGKNLGLAFQIVDDLLDIISDEKTLGKPAMNDFKEGKTTLPYIFLYDRLDSSGKERLKTLFKKELKKDEEEWIKSSMKKSGAIEDSFKVVFKLADEALEAIKEFKNSDLERIIKDMVQREY